MVRERLIIAQSDQQAADDWIMDRCDPFQAVVPVNRGTVLVIDCSPPGAMLILMVGADRGWCADDSRAFFANENEEVVLQEVAWVERFARVYAFEDSLEIDLRTILDCEFDTTANAAAFRLELKAQIY
ncbi:hypothetical protein SAMN05444678_1305 [Sphingomonas sp. YR710]|uniref:hypothetical protein n=1 Tax=Sphingomonas sp. YR710 TaxID=1882773 RepID=UPI000889F975|nr:hypothetical protein [Sphingomonas sp. YR710]SDD88215.1 hypothetical protein SAMN05444678_1305 [Sphingomonas sp. YR710]